MDRMTTAAELSWLPQAGPWDTAIRTFILASASCNNKDSQLNQDTTGVTAMLRCTVKREYEA